MLTHDVIDELENYLRNSVTKSIFDALEESGADEKFMVRGGVETSAHTGEHVHISLHVRNPELFAGSNISTIHSHVSVNMARSINGEYIVSCSVIPPGEIIPASHEFNRRFILSTKADIKQERSRIKDAIKSSYMMCLLKIVPEQLLVA